MRFSAAALATLAITSFATSLGAEQTAQKKSPTKTPSSGTQKSTAAASQRPLVLSGSVPLEGVKGRFDHFAFGQGRVFVSALGNDTVEVINVFGGIVEHTITGVPNPQGVVFSPETHKLFVASAKGKVYIYDAGSFDLISSVAFEGRADNLRYDAANKRIYVACGDDEKNAAIATIDATTNQRLEEEYKLGGEPESFQLESSGPNIYVNIPELKQIAVINRNTKEITRWPLTGLRLNFPMALDEADHRLFVGIREPARLAIFDTTTGHLIVASPSAEDTDDLYYDAEHKRVYVPGGEGVIDVFQMNDPDHYRLLAKIPTSLGGRTAGYFGRQDKGMHRFFLAVPARGGQNAELRIFTVQE
jgi:hypothetical protein